MPKECVKGRICGLFNMSRVNALVRNMMKMPADQANGIIKV